MYSFLSMKAILHLKSSGAIPKKVRIFIRLVTHICTKFRSFSFEMTLVIQ